MEPSWLLIVAQILENNKIYGHRLMIMLCCSFLILHRTVLVILGRCGEAFPREELLLTIYLMVSSCLFDTQVSDDDYSSRYIQSLKSCDEKLWAAVGAVGSQSKTFLQL